jgi:hypothetical protein
MSPNSVDVGHQKPVSEAPHLPDELLIGLEMTRPLLDLDDNGSHVGENSVKDP